MGYFTAYCTDMGAAGKKNQDALVIMTAAYRGTEYAFAAVCDGVGGLHEGENASSYVTEMLSEWFSSDFSELIKNDASLSEIKSSLDTKLNYLNSCMNSYGTHKGYLLATTLTASLFLPGKCILTVNSGDTRFYRIKDRTEQITEDNSVVGEKVRLGLISEESAGSDPRQNQITRCIGAGFKKPGLDYYETEFEPDCCYMICSDGFRKKIRQDEIFSKLSPDLIRDEETLQRNTEYLTDLNLHRDENDNITAAVIKITN